MRRAGRVSLLPLVVIAGVIAMVVVLLFSKEGPAAAGTRFMDALARGDVQALVENSVAGEKTPEELRKDWEFATQVAAKHYMFRWRILSSRTVSDDTADVRLQVLRNYSPSSYEENFGLPMKKVDGKWKVDAAGISREMYPGLPRSTKD